MLVYHYHSYTPFKHTHPELRKVLKLYYKEIRPERASLALAAAGLILEACPSRHETHPDPFANFLNFNVNFMVDKWARIDASAGSLSLTFPV